MDRPDLITVTEHGLHCAAGDFWIDPWKPVPRAIVTHAHADHTRPNMGRYVSTPEGAAMVRRRVHKGALVDELPYGEVLRLGGAKVSLHPAGHVLGSAMVRIEVGGEVWVAAGDYKTAFDPTCAAIDPVRCDAFVTESTFGLPVFRWDEPDAVMAQVRGWWEINAANGRTSMLYAYALGKAQRLLAGVLGVDRPIGVHGAVLPYLPAYEAAGVNLPSVVHANQETAEDLRGTGLVIAPPSAFGTAWSRRFGDQASGFASGWMRMRGPRRRRGFETGFVLSDHADWDGLLATVAATGASRVRVTHGYVDPLVHALTERGLDARPLATPYEGEIDETAGSADGKGSGEGAAASKPEGEAGR